MNSTALRVASRANRPGPQRRCPPCPACGDDAMRQYGAKHHGVVHRYFYVCQTCQHTDVWRELDDSDVKRWERMKEPLAEPRYEQCRLELPRPSRFPKNAAYTPDVTVHKPDITVHKPDYSQLFALCLRGDSSELETVLKDEFDLRSDVIPVLKGLAAVAIRSAGSGVP